MLDLAGQWSLSDESGEYKIPFVLPGDAISALHDAGAIPDPYHGRNEYDLRWICQRDWTATRRFVTDRTDLALFVSMLDTVADVMINGQVVLQADNMFRTYRRDVSSVLVAGENEIAIRFRSAPREAAARQAAQPWFIPFSTNNTPIGNGNMLRKQQCDFGWDWNIALAPFGLYGGIRLEPAMTDDFDFTVTQVHSEGRVTLQIDATVPPGCAGLPIAAEAAGVRAERIADGQQVRLELVIDAPGLWWPAGLGGQPLHDVTVSLGSMRKTRRIGLRKIELITEKDASGMGFRFRVNGRDVFARGANWIPADALAGRITREAVRDLLQSAVDANMNMIRVWGGGRYEPSWFYDLCDEMGLMVWQDFMFACHLYPADDGFLDEVYAEAFENAHRLRHHPCIALWCGDNELIGALTWFPESRENRDRYLVGYDRLNRTIERALKDADPGANWWPSSPSPGPMSFGDAWHDDASGDMHFWSVWHEGRDFDHYRDVKPRFCSEFGFQSYPSMNVIRKFAGKGDLNIASPVMESHQKNAGGNARIAETMFRYFRFPLDFENFVYLSQVQQGLAIKTAVTHWRGLKPHCMGTLYWQLNDTWPVCSWSSLDHGGGWKLLHHMARHFFAPVLVTAVPSGPDILLRAINDGLESVRLEVDAYAVSTSGDIRHLGTSTADVPHDRAIDTAALPGGTLKDDEFLSFTWRSPGGPVAGDIHAPKPWKAYDLLDPGLTRQITRTDTGWKITLSAERPALFVAVETDTAGRFSNNAVTIYPGYPAEIGFTPKTPGTEPRFVVRDLHSATYGPA